MKNFNMSQTLCAASAVITIFVLFVFPAKAGSYPEVISDSTYHHCLLTAIESADENDRVKEIKQECAALVKTKLPKEKHTKNGIISRLIEAEQASSANHLAIVQHNSNYFIPLAYNSTVNNDPYVNTPGINNLKHYESKFQFSLKAQIFDAVLNERGRIFVGYTNQSYWQLYSQENSLVIRETNHQPELFIDIEQNLDLFGWHMPLVRYGFAHQSNGQASELSRSWNRVYAKVFLEKDNWAMSLQPWIQVDGDSAEEDNPNITSYMGNFELGVFYQGDTSTTAIKWRNNLRSVNRGSIELSWSKKLPYSEKFRLLVQYFNGYGENLIDYNASSNRIGVGIQLSEFL